MERLQRRRANFLDALFGEAQNLGDASVRFLRPAVVGRFAPARELALLSDGIDDLFVLPGWMCVRPGSIGEQLVRRQGFEPVEVVSANDQAHSGAAYYRSGRDAEAVSRTLSVLGELTAIDRPDERRSASLVHGFIAHQKTLPCSDPELAAAVAAPTCGNGRGSGVTVRIVDNGMAAVVPWTIPASPATPADVDPLKGVTAPKYLGRAAGHGTFIAGLIHQVAPDVSTLVHLVANAEGFVDEVTLSNVLRSISAVAPPDIVVLPFGGYSVKLGSFGTTGGASDQWLDPIGLRAALDDLVARCPGTVVIASAGNNDSPDRCFPAAFSDDPTFEGHVVSVAALDSSGYRAGFSNYGAWVSASALGVRLRSMYVIGNENPANDPDGPPERFRPRSFAQWSGTSFSAPLVAGRVAETLAALRAQYGPSVTAVDAWRLVHATSHRQREGFCGVRVLVDGVTHG